MADDFVVIGVTLPDAKVNNEAGRIIGMLESGVIDRMHLRKPESDISVLRKLLGGNSAGIPLTAVVA